MNDAKGMVFDIDRFSTHDGPGIRTAVFLKGCPLRCRWCHSPESQRSTERELAYQRALCSGCGACSRVCPRGAITRDGEVVDGVAGMRVDRAKCDVCLLCVAVCPCRAMRRVGREYSASALVDSVRADIPFFRNSGGGVTVTGGEPLMQPEFTHAFLSGCRELGIHTMLETCGQGDYGDLERIAGVCSGIFFDVKLLDGEMHREWTGISNKTILENLRRLCAEAADKVTVRVPCIPEVNDDPECVRDIARLVKSLGIPVRAVKVGGILKDENHIGCAYREVTEAGDKYTVYVRRGATLFEREAVLWHELAHIVLGHLLKERELQNMVLQNKTIEDVVGYARRGEPENE
jgi:pyruvate formate lyase activating enzyme